VLQDRHQHHGDRLAEIQQISGTGEDLARVAQVGVDVFGGTTRVAGQQRPGMGEHNWVVVGIDDPAFRRDGLGDLMGVARGRDAGADVEELPDASFFDQETHCPREVRPVRARGQHDVGEGIDRLIASRPVGGEVVLAA
jgi:hypothetical protein